MKRCWLWIALLAVTTSAGAGAAPSPSPSATAAARPAVGTSPAASAPSRPAQGVPTVRTESGLSYQDLVVGKGAAPRPGQTIVVHYRGYLLGGRMFESSYGRRPLIFVLGDRDVIAGMEEGISSMRVGGKRRLVIPPHLGYRDEIVGTIPPDSTLEFVVELIAVK